MIDVLSDQFILRGVPEHIRSDNGPEFLAKAVQDWIGAVGAKTAYIERGKSARAASCRAAAVDPLGGEAFLPAPDTGLGLTGLTHDRVRPDPVGAEQYDLRPPNVLLRRVAVADQSAQPSSCPQG